MIAAKQPKIHTKIPVNIDSETPENSKIANATKVKIYIAPVIRQHKIFLSAAITAENSAPNVTERNCVTSFKTTTEFSLKLPLDISAAATPEQINDTITATTVPIQADGSNAIPRMVLLFFDK